MMADNPSSELGSSWFVVERSTPSEGVDSKDNDGTLMEEFKDANASPASPTPSSLTISSAVEATTGPPSAATPSDGALDLSLETTSSVGGYASSEHSDFEVFEQDNGEEASAGLLGTADDGVVVGEEEEDEEEFEEGENGVTRRRRYPTVRAAVEEAPMTMALAAHQTGITGAACGSSSHEERIRLALHNLRAEDALAAGQPLPSSAAPITPVLEVPLSVAGNVQDVTMAVRQVAEPPRVQIIRLNSDEESLPESDIQLEEIQEPAPNVVPQEQFDQLMEGDRVRRYQHQPNPNLNARLNSLVMCALLFVIGLAVGHFVGSTHERFSQHFERVDRMDRIKSIQSELLRCAHKYDELELQLNDLKATLVQKEYVDKWESLYQEGEEEKAALTATMNLYKSRYNKQKQLLTQCEMKYQDLEEQFDKMKTVLASGRPRPPSPVIRDRLVTTPPTPVPSLELLACEKRSGDLDIQVKSLEARVKSLDERFKNCSTQPRCGDLTEQLMERLKSLRRPNASVDAYAWLVRQLHFPSGDDIGNRTQKVFEQFDKMKLMLRQRFNVSTNVTEVVGNWLKAVYVSGSSGDTFAQFLTNITRRVNASRVRATVHASAAAVSGHVEQLFDLLSAAILRSETAGPGTPTAQRPAPPTLYQRVSRRLRELGAEIGGRDGESGAASAVPGGLAAAWRRALDSTRALWRDRTRPASPEAASSPTEAPATAPEASSPTAAFPKRRLASVDTPDVSSSADNASSGPSEAGNAFSGSSEADSGSNGPSEADSASSGSKEAKNTFTWQPVAWFERRATGRQQFRQRTPSGDWYWRWRTAAEGDWADDGHFWAVQRAVRRAEQRLWLGLGRLTRQVELRRWWDRRRRLREKARRKEEKKRRREENWRRKEERRRKVEERWIRREMRG